MRGAAGSERVGSRGSRIAARCIGWRQEYWAQSELGGSSGEGRWAMVVMAVLLVAGAVVSAVGIVDPLPRGAGGNAPGPGKVESTGLRN